MSGNEHASSRVEFESTVDEDVDVQIRLANSMESFTRQRRGHVRRTALSATAAAPVGLLIGFGHIPSAAVVVSVTAFGALVGVGLGPLVGRYFDWRVRRGARRMVDELRSGAVTVHQEIALRSDGLWCRSRGVETLLPWSKFSRTNDTAEAVELWFSLPALARVPDRAFRSREHRLEFVDHAAVLAAARSER